MARATPATIILKNVENCVQNEYVAGGTITPGHLVALGAVGTVAVHGVAGGTATVKMFALEDDLQGRGIADNYDATTHKNVRCQVCPPGTEVYAWIATGQAIAVGDPLESAGNGQLREHVAQSGSPTGAIRVDQIVAIALQAIDSTSPVGVSRIRVRVV